MMIILFNYLILNICFDEFRIHNRTRETSLSSISQSTSNRLYHLREPKRLQFKFDGTSIGRAIEFARCRLNQAISDQQLATLQFNSFGKDTIREFHLSPDSFVQNAIQLAYYRKHGYFRATYESAQTSKFYRGRTETVRSCTNESRKFVSMMMTAHPPINYSIREKYEALKAAVIRHTELMNEAVNGEGIDRHLLGLQLLLRHDIGESAAIFNDPAYSFTNHWFLSTSQLSSNYFENKGWGEVVLDGFGIGYMIKNHSLHFNVTSRHLGSHDMCHHIEESLLDLADLCRKAFISSHL